MFACHGYDELPGLPKDARTWQHVIRLQPGGLLARDPRWASQAQTLIDATRAVIESPRFRQVVLETSGLRESALGPSVDSRVLLAAYLGAQPRRGMLAADVTVADKHVASGTPGSTRVCVKDKVARIRLQPYVLRQWATISIDLKSCAINTLAHELTHTIVDGDTPMFTDGHMGLARLLSHRLASYGIGTIAQCVYLEQASSLPRSAITECLERGSANHFRGCPQLSDSDSLDSLSEDGACPASVAAPRR